jgi:hypothetical protein
MSCSDDNCVTNHPALIEACKAEGITFNSGLKFHVLKAAIERGDLDAFGKYLDCFDVTKVSRYLMDITRDFEVLKIAVDKIMQRVLNSTQEDVHRTLCSFIKNNALFKHVFTKYKIPASIELLTCMCEDKEFNTHRFLLVDPLKLIAKELPEDQVKSVFKEQMKNVKGEKVLKYMIKTVGLTEDEIDIDGLLDEFCLTTVRSIVGGKFNMTEQRVKKALQHACYNVDFDDLQELAKNYVLKREYLDDVLPKYEEMYYGYRDLNLIIPMITMVVDKMIESAQK